MIAGLELPTSGQIFLGDEDVTFKRASHRDIAFVFQLFALYPHMNVRANIAFPLRLAGRAARRDRAKVAEAARMLRIEHLLDKPVSGLSSGDRQRVALGRAIVRQPLAFMMDEPLGALDSEFRELMCQELRALHDRLQATTVYVTHDQLEAMSMADTIAIMNQGVIEQLGAPQEVYDRPASVFVADFIGSPSMNFLPFEGGYAAGARQVRIGDAAAGRARRCARTRRQRRCCSACGPSTCASAPTRRCAPRCWAPSTWAPARSSPADGAGHDCCAPSVGADVPAQRGDQVGLAFDADAGVAVRRGQRPRAAHRAPRAPRRRALARSAVPEPPMAELRLRRRRQALRRRSQAVRDLDLDVAERRVHRAARPQRRRQDDDAAPGGRAGEARRRPRAHRRPRRDRRSRRRCAT